MARQVTVTTLQLQQDIASLRQMVEREVVTRLDKTNGRVTELERERAQVARELGALEEADNRMDRIERSVEKVAETVLLIHHEWGSQKTWGKWRDRLLSVIAGCVITTLIGVMLQGFTWQNQPSQIGGGQVAIMVDTPTATVVPTATEPAPLPSAAPTATRAPVVITPTQVTGTPRPASTQVSTCAYFDRGARKPELSLSYMITQGNAQNVRDAPSWGRVIESIPRIDAESGQIARYQVYWIFGDWLALDNECSRWVAKWLGKLVSP